MTQSDGILFWLAIYSPTHPWSSIRLHYSKALWWLWKIHRQCYFKSSSCFKISYKMNFAIDSVQYIVKKTGHGFRQIFVSFLPQLFTSFDKLLSWASVSFYANEVPLWQLIFYLNLTQSWCLGIWLHFYYFEYSYEKVSGWDSHLFKSLD